MGTLWTGAEFRQMAFDSYFEHLPLDWASDITVGPFRIKARRTIHHVPTSALLVEAAGRKLGYSSDTAFDPRADRRSSRPRTSSSTRPTSDPHTRRTRRWPLFPRSCARGCG